jgi:hypothetical protein
MTKLLEEVLHHVEQLSEGRQDDAAHVLLAMLENDAASYRLTDEQLAEVELAVAEANGGLFAGAKEIAEVLYRPWA